MHSEKHVPPCDISKMCHHNYEHCWPRRIRRKKNDETFHFHPNKCRSSNHRPTRRQKFNFFIQSLLFFSSQAEKLSPTHVDFFFLVGKRRMWDGGYFLAKIQRYQVGIVFLLWSFFPLTRLKREPASTKKCLYRHHRLLHTSISFSSTEMRLMKSFLSRRCTYCAFVMPKNYFLQRRRQRRSFFWATSADMSLSQQCWPTFGILLINEKLLRFSLAPTKFNLFKFKCFLKWKMVWFKHHEIRDLTRSNWLRLWCLSTPRLDTVLAGADNDTGC